MTASRLAAVSTLSLDDTQLAEELLSLRDCLRWATSEFHTHRLHFGHGTASAWDEAVALVLGALHLPWDVDPAVLDARLLGIERRRIVALVRERIETRRPLPYLLGEAFFAGYPFDVDERVLIPRSPIAELIEHDFAAWFPELPPGRVLDMCTGSGCIGIATALVLPTCEVALADISQDALAVARQNITRHDVGDRVRAVESDVFDGLEGQRFDLIVSNPPYVDAEDFADMPAEYQHEPAMGLACGDDGLDLVRRMLAEAADHLSERGLLIVGATPFSLELATQLRQLEVPVTIADNSWQRLSPARHAGIPTYHGEILSEATDERLDLAQFQVLAATTDNEAYNALVCTEFAPEIGRDNVYQLGDASNDEDPRALPESLRGRALFSAGHGVEDIIQREEQGWTFRKTRISEQFDFDAAKASLSEGGDMLLLLRKSGALRFFTHASRPTPQPGDTILTYVPPSKPKPKGEDE